VNSRDVAKAHSATTPVIVVRQGPGRYQMAHLGDIRWEAAHIDERQYMNLDPGKPFLTKKYKVAVPDMVRVVQPYGGTIVAARADRLAESARRPSAKALARVEAALAATVAARAELRAAQKAAFAYGKPIPISTVKAADRDRRKATGS
jgi:hypothetical protein